ncbi:MAG: hypothetical protein ABI367_11025 [Mucilaginibacter sp.]
MDTKPIQIPKKAIQSVAGGLLLMAFFTIAWAGIASGSLQNTGRVIDLVFFGACIITFTGYAIYFFRSVKLFQGVMTEEEKIEGKKAGKAFGIVFGLEGILIFVAVNICVNLGHPELTVPAIALVVGLHFYPMGKIFKRTMDYYLATWSTAIAIGAMVLILKHVVLPIPVLAMLGIGMAISTSIYGLNMIRVGLGYLK